VGRGDRNARVRIPFKTTQLGGANERTLRGSGNHILSVRAGPDERGRVNGSSRRGHAGFVARQ